MAGEGLPRAATGDFASTPAAAAPIFAAGFAIGLAIGTAYFQWRERRGR